jgi:UDP-glucuronate 4-epimerase
MMSEERFLVTGALGCIGAWVVRRLLHEGVSTTVFDLGMNKHRLELIMDADELNQVRFIQGDIAELDGVEGAVKDTGTTHIIHLAALQVPFCKANASLGARVNVVGTVNIFEAAKRAGLKHVVYASSVAVYGRSEDYEETELPNDAQPKPRTLYGVYKQANEATAKVYWWDDGISSIGLRPYTVYGPGRDQGLTSAPTRAMLAAAAGKSFHIPFGGKIGYQYVDDTAQMFIQAARIPFEGAEAFGLRGSVATMPEIIAAIEVALPSARGTITYDDKPLPFPESLDDSELKKALGSLPFTPLSQAVSQTIHIFKEALAEGRISVES